jgi:hypothetical protein
MIGIAMRRLAVLLAAPAIVTLALCGLARPSGADAPTQQGWWWTANSSTPALPVTGLPGVPLPAPAAPSAALPAPPDVPTNGLLVEGGLSVTAPIAYAAIVYSVPSGYAVTTLTLTVTPNSATTTTAGYDATPKATLQVCPLSVAYLIAEQGGPISDAPKYTCTTSASAAASASGATFTFDASNLVSNGSLAVAILPTQPTDRVVFDQPGTEAIGIRPSAQSTTTPSSGSTDSGQASSPTTLPVSTLTPSYSSSPPPSSYSSPGGTSQSPASPAAAAPAASKAPFTVPPMASASFGYVKANLGVIALFLAAAAAAAALWANAGRTKPSTAAATDSLDQSG